jgi:hypothetical protein
MQLRTVLLLHDFCNIIFKDKYKLHIASGSVSARLQLKILRACLLDDSF